MRTYFHWELCDGSSCNLVDLWGGCTDEIGWQMAKRYFKNKGYRGKFLLIKQTGHSFRVYRVNIK